MEIRNVAIIAHVDHGKTTLVDALLRQSQTKLGKEGEGADLIMDSNELERERGITIFSKNASVRIGDTKINIIDTPGHADFGGEVERVLSMADGGLLLVDAKEGPMPQTRFVLRQALARGLKIIVVINKIDKPDARPEWVHDKTFDLFVELGAPDDILDFPVLYASAKAGKAGLTHDLSSMTDVTPVFDAILAHVPKPKVDIEKPLQILVTQISGDEFKGRLATGRVQSGVVKNGQEVVRFDREGVPHTERITALMTFEGLGRQVVEEAQAGDIVAISGFPDVLIGETIADPINPVPLPVLRIEEPTVKMTFTINDSPFMGTEGEFTTSRQIRDRLHKELETDMALRVEDAPSGSSWTVYGRGELHLAILIERMRREGFELQVSRPQIVPKVVDGQTLVPYEQVSIEVPEVSSGVVIQKLGARNGELREMRTEGPNVFLEYVIPTRGLLGYRSEFLTDTRGMGIINSTFLEYRKDMPNWRERQRGSLVAHESGETRAFGIVNVQDQGHFFVGPGTKIYKGQVVGERSRAGDLRVNPCKEKQLSNMRSKGDGPTDHIDTPRTLTLEDALEYIGDDEYVEVTPKSVRIRKQILDEGDARRIARGIK